MRIKLSVAALVLGSTMMAIGCGGPWTIVKQANPNPFNAQTQFAVAPVTFNNLKVGKKMEGEWLATKKPETQMSHQNDKASFSARFQQACVSRAKGLPIQPLVEGAPFPGFTVHGNVYWMEPGVYAVVYSISTQVRMMVDIVDPAGQVADQFEVSANVAPQIPFTPIVMYTVVDRLNRAAEEVAGRVDQYLRLRTGLPK